ncbi:plasmid replicase, partial (plasmid) [Acinetobacter haemolyticus]
HYQEFIDRQSRKGAMGGKKSKGGGRPSLGEPWKELGISRATYFRKKSL